MTPKYSRKQLIFRDIDDDMKAVWNRASIIAYQDSGLETRSWKQEYFKEYALGLAQWHISGFDPQKTPDFLPQWLRDLLADMELDED